MKNLFVAFVALFLVKGPATLAQSIGGTIADPGEFPYFGTGRRIFASFVCFFSFSF